MNKDLLFIILIFIVIVTSTTSWAKRLIGVQISTKKIDLLPYINFNLKNDSTNDIYCRKVTVPNVEYFLDGVFFNSLDASVGDFYLRGKEQADLLQNISTSLTDMYNFKGAFELKFDNKTLITACEKVETRLSNLYVLDDVSTCSNKSTRISHFLVDYGNNTLVPSKQQIKIPLTQDSKVYKDPHTRSWIKQQGNNLFLLKSSDNRTFEQKHILSLSEGSNRKFVGITWIDTKAPVLFFIDSGDLIVELYRLEPTGIMKFVASASYFLTDIKQKKRYKQFIGGLIIFHKYYSNHNALRVNLVYRMAKKQTYNTVVEENTLKWIRPQPLVYNQTASDVRKYKQVTFDFTDDKVTVVSSTPVSSDILFNTIKQEGFERTSTLTNEIRTGDLQIQAQKKTLLYKFGSVVSQLDGFCNIQQIFSDKVSPRDEINLDSLFAGRNQLIRAVQMQNNVGYQKLLDLISRGANVNAVADLFGNRPIHWAVGIHDLRFLKLLLKSNADVNIHNKTHQTPLMREVNMRFMLFHRLPDEEIQQVYLNRSKEVITLLLKHKAKKSLKNNKGETAYDIASKYNAPLEILELLRVTK